MTRFRLRHALGEVDLRPGEFIIGRGTVCNLMLEDGLVSRTHAKLVVDGGSVSVEDMASRNGVRVNGQKISATTPLRHLDRVGIGSQEMLLIDVNAEDATRKRVDTCATCGAELGPRDPACRTCGAIPNNRRNTIEAATMEFRIVPPDGSGRMDAGFALVASIAGKALALGHHEEAERILATSLDALLTRASEGTVASAQQLKEANDFARKLAEGLGTPRWIAWIFGMHTATQRLMDPDTVDHLYELVRRARFSDVKTVQRYLDVLQPKSAQMNPADRFLVKRIEGLLRLIAA